jgi:hypothetical protein
VKFSDGTSVPIKLRRWPDFRVSDPTLSARQNIDRMRPLADQGDHAAQFVLAP